MGSCLDPFWTLTYTGDLGGKSVTGLVSGREFSESAAECKSSRGPSHRLNRKAISHWVGSIGLGPQRMMMVQLQADISVKHERNMRDGRISHRFSMLGLIDFAHY